METAIRNAAEGRDIDLIVVTDAEAILGIGDWGTNGVSISVGKLMVYTAAAGLDPARVLPVVLDAGTNRESLLQDPLYLGLHENASPAPPMMILLIALLPLWKGCSRTFICTLKILDGHMLPRS